jgi:hypothetical protein
MSIYIGKKEINYLTTQTEWSGGMKYKTLE